MEPALVVFLLALVFAGTHVGLATGGIRSRLVARLGEGGFLLAYSLLVASLTFWALVAYYAAHRFEGAPGLALGAVTAGARRAARHDRGRRRPRRLRALRLPPRLAAFDQPIRPPYGLERITRHPFFAGTALIGIAHVLLANRLAGAVLMGALAVLSIAGARHQDVKLRAQVRTDPTPTIWPSPRRSPSRRSSADGSGSYGASFRSAGARSESSPYSRFDSSHEDIFASGGRWMMLAVIGGAAGRELATAGVAREASAARAEREARPVRFGAARGRLEGTRR